MTIALVIFGLFLHAGGVILALATGSAVNQSEADPKKGAQAGIGILATAILHTIGLALVYAGGAP